MITTKTTTTGTNIDHEEIFENWKPLFSGCKRLSDLSAIDDIVDEFIKQGDMKTAAELNLAICMFALELEQKKPKTNVIEHVINDERWGECIIEVSNVFTLEECQNLLKGCTEYEPALINVGEGQQELDTDYRKCSRCIRDEPDTANFIYDRIKEFIPEVSEHETSKPIGLNERLRFLRYFSGDYFKPHQDGSYSDENRVSYLTLQVYLNEDFKGGATMFKNGPDMLSIKPKTGSIIIFDHSLWHEGEIVQSGIKYCLRTDVMYLKECT